ncbi:hypothetical protein GCM10017714_32380 [Curtobacterium pusillum]|uniref:Secreted protein n=1 Tax=Curtobacterium pusillum TaxID=69373 RepID=A0AAW3T7I8_9MICO|nr:hypothetical protein [Curtobacterium pusillum]MBA8990860.1 hypothetical protein [Curtobacterium pusillum]NUU14727.1 hypothetical protein [Curtobacterium pusillum]GLK31728.1 hypothetical protein GCM10017610_20130 [Curtobacterium pusillum]
MRKRMLAVLGCTVAAVTIALAAPASAVTVTPSADQPNTVAPGQTAEVGAVVYNQYGSAQSGGVALYLTAPENSTFTSDTVMGEQIIEGVRQGRTTLFSNCVRSNADTQMRCSGTLTVPAAGNGKLSGVDITTTIRVSTNAAPATTYTAAGGFNLSNSGNGQISGGGATIAFTTASAVPTPVFGALPRLAADAVGTVGLAIVLDARALLGQR